VDGFVSTIAESVTFKGPSGVICDRDNNLYVTMQHRILKILIPKQSAPSVAVARAIALATAAVAAGMDDGRSSPAPQPSLPSVTATPLTVSTSSSSLNNSGLPLSGSPSSTTTASLPPAAPTVISSSPLSIASTFLVTPTQCAQDTTHSPSLYCEDCHEPLCSTCDAIVHRSTKRSGHRRLAFGDDTKQPITEATNTPAAAGTETKQSIAAQLNHLPIGWDVRRDATTGSQPRMCFVVVCACACLILRCQ
jgi:hypothetical protein